MENGERRRRLDRCIYIVDTYGMTTTVQKWGNSLAVRLSKNVAGDADIEEGSVVEVSAKDSGIVIRVAEKTKEYSLTELVKGITPNNIHAAVEWGKPVGKEVW